MIQETNDFVLHLFRGGDAQLSSLFTADQSLATPALASFYGEGVAWTGADGVITLDPRR